MTHDAFLRKLYNREMERKYDEETIIKMFEPTCRDNIGRLYEKNFSLPLITQTEDSIKTEDAGAKLFQDSFESGGNLG